MTNGAVKTPGLRIFKVLPKWELPWDCRVLSVPVGSLLTLGAQSPFQLRTNKQTNSEHQCARHLPPSGSSRAALAPAPGGARKPVPSPWPNLLAQPATVVAPS